MPLGPPEMKLCSRPCGLTLTLIGLPGIGTASASAAMIAMAAVSTASVATDLRNCLSICSPSLDGPDRRQGTTLPRAEYDFRRESGPGAEPLRTSPLEPWGVADHE